MCVEGEEEEVMRVCYDHERIDRALFVLKGSAGDGGGGRQLWSPDSQHRLSSAAAHLVGPSMVALAARPAAAAAPEDNKNVIYIVRRNTAAPVARMLV